MSDPSAPPYANRLSDYIPDRLAIMSNAVSSLISGAYRREFGLKIMEWQIMAVLGDAGALTQRDLVSATLMDKVAATVCWVQSSGRCCLLAPGAAHRRTRPGMKEGCSLGCTPLSFGCGRAFTAAG